MNKKIIIIDGNSLIYRAYHGMRPLTTKEGIYTHGVYGFLRMLESLVKEEQPDGLGVAFDVGKTFRHEMYEGYKEGRKKTPEDLKSQFPLLKEALGDLGIPVLEKEGFEADDILGTVSKLGGEKGDQVILVTGDKDAFQLIDKNTTLYLTRKGLSQIEKLDEDGLRENYGFTPKEAIDIKGLQGDPSDNIKGVRGIGSKTALNLVCKYGSLEGIYEHIDELKGKMKENLIEQKEDAFFSREIGIIKKDVPIEYNDLEYSIDKYGSRKKLKELFKKLEIKNVFKDYLNDDNEMENKNFIEPIVIKVQKDFVTSFNKLDKDRITIYLEIEDKDIRYIQVFDGKLALDYMPPLLNPAFTLEILKLVIGYGGKVIFYDTKSFYHLLLNNGLGVEGRGAEDLSLMSYVIYPERKYTFNNFLEDILGSSGEEKFNSQYLTLAYDILLAKAKEEDVLKVYENIEKPLVSILAKMEHRGIGIDRNYLKEMEKEINEKIEELRLKIWELSGEEFNINSPSQLGKILFDKLKLPALKKTKTGYSTNQEVLEKLYEQHEIIPLILEYRKLNKLFNTYIEALLEETKGSSIIHTNYNQTVAVTGRLSSENPNLQNIPVRMTEGRLIRKAFIPVEKENLILCGDYSQIELRVLAHISEDEGLIEAFNRGIDIHAKTASEVFEVPLDKVDSNMRRTAKAVNFGIVYGISDFGLSRDLNIPISKSKEYIEKYFARYPKVRQWIEKTLREAKETLKVYTLTGRYRNLPELKSSQYLVRSSAERMAMNAPIQGTAADLIKIAMINVDNRMVKENVKSKMILQVHDELIIEVCKDEVEIVKNILKEEMTKAMTLKVPLIVDFKIGSNWYDVEEF